MSALSIQPTFPIFTETDGLPLENGYIWLGTANLDPQGNPINVYWDAALTIPAGQPIRTINGYPSRNGTPARIYVNSDYSIRVQNSKGSLVYSAPQATERYGNIISLADLNFTQSGTGAVTYSALDKARQVFSLADFGAVGDGVTDDTAAIQLAVNAATAGQWVDGINKTYKITGEITGTNTVFRLRNVKFVFSTSYTTQGYFRLDAGSTTTAMTVDLENIIVDGGRGTYKVGNEPWEVFATFAGYDSIQPTLPPIFRVDSYNANTVVTMRSVNFHNVHSDACVQINTYGTVFIDDCEYKNISNKTFHVYHSPDDGVTQAGRTLVNNVYAQDVGMMPATFTVGGVAKVRADPYAPQGSFNFIVSHGDFTLNNAIVWNYASCGVTADRNRSFTASDVFIYHDDGNAFSNNPSGAFWLEDCNTTNVSNLFVWVTDRQARDTALDSSLLEIYATSVSQTNFTNVVLLTDPTTPKVRKIIRGAMFNNPSVNITNFYCYGITTNPPTTVDFGVLPTSSIGHDIKLKNGYIRHGSINVDQPLLLTVDDVWCYGQTSGGNITVSVSGNPGITGSVNDVVITNNRLAGAFTNSVTITGSLKVNNNKRIAGNVTCGTVTGFAQVNDNSYIGGNITVTSGGSTVGISNIMNNSQIVGTTNIAAAQNARVSGNNTQRRIELNEVQTFEIVGNTAKTDAAESIIWINPNTVANILAGVISSNNVLIKTGTVGAGYVTIIGGVTGVTDVNNNKLTVAWS